MKNRAKDVLVLLYFGLIVALFAYTYMKIGKLMVVSDGSFHFSRVEEIYRNLREHHSLTFIATHTFNHSGVGNFLFYPTVFLYPWALLRFIFNPINAYIIWYSSFLYATLVIAYYAMRSFSGSRCRSFFFALIYAIASYHMYLGNTNFVLGEFMAYTFIPLAFLGFYNIVWGNEKRWKPLGVGMALIIYSHVLSTYITTLLFVVLIVARIIVKRGLEIKRIISLLKSIGLFLCLSSFFFVPFMTDYVGGDLYSPKAGFMYLPEIDRVWDLSLANNGSSNWSIGLVLLIVAIVGWYSIRSNTTEKVIYALGVLLLILLTNITPWQLFSQQKLVLSILGLVQFPYRFISYVTLLLSISGSYILANLKFKNNYSLILFTIGMGILLSINYYSLNSQVLQKITTSTDYLPVGREAVDVYPWNKVVDKDNYNNIFSYLVIYGERDYYPMKAYNNADNILNNTILVNGNKVSKAQNISNNKIRYILKVTRGEIVDLPVVAYNSTKLKVGGRSYSHQISKRGTVQIEAPKTGVLNFEVSYQVNRWYYILMTIACLTWLLLLSQYGIRQIFKIK